MKRRRTIFLVGFLLMLLAGGAWIVFGRADSQVEKVKQIEKELFASGKRPSREDFEKFRKEVDKLSPQQRWQAMSRGPGDRMRKEMDAYFNLPKDKRAAYLRDRIQEMEKHRAEMEANGPPKGLPPNGGPPPGANGQGPGGPPPGGPGGPGGPGQRDPARERERLAGMLGHLSPTDRARFSAFHDAMAKERMAMGLSPMPAPPSRPPGGQPSK
ncbi:MAG: hypothetical protein LLG00_09680 [Planctomycetaceae bacterium]|nr:hypothetical protein [Planctomycetaceae bacterium]